MSTIKIDTGKGKGKNLTKEVYKAWEKEQGVTQNVYEKINELIFDEEIHKYIYCSDPFLRKAFGDFLLSLGFNINETVDAMNECWYFIYVDLEHYVFNYKETDESNSKTSENIQLPYDWNKAKQDVINYLDEHPIPEKEVVEITDEIMNTNNPIGWDDDPIVDEFSDEFSDTSAVVERTNKIFEFANAKQGYYILCKNKLHGQKIMVAMGFCKNIDKVLGGSNQSAFFFDENRFNTESIELINGDKYGHIGYTIKAMSFADVVADINGETKLQADEKQTILLTECPVVFSDEEITEIVEVVPQLPNTNNIQNAVMDLYKVDVKYLQENATNEFEVSSCLQEYNTPTDVVIVGADIDGRDVEITDDFSSYGIYINKKITNLSFDSEGHVKILTLPTFREYLKENNDDFIESIISGAIDVVLLKNFIGKIELVVKDGDLFTTKFDINYYIQHQIDGASVYLNLPENTNIIELPSNYFSEIDIVEETEFDEDEAEETLDELADDLGTPITSFIFGFYNISDPSAPNTFGFMINPKEYFDKYGYSYDQHITAITEVPVGVEEVCEADFIYNGSDIDAISALVSDGFKFNIAFQNFIEAHGSQTPYIINGMPIVDYIKVNYPNSIV